MASKLGAIVGMLALLALSCEGSATTTSVENTPMTGANDDNATDSNGVSTQATGDVGDSSQASPQSPANESNPTAPSSTPGSSSGTASGSSSPGASTGGTSTASSSGMVPVGATLRTTTTLNMRTGPGTENSVRLVLPEGSDTIAVNGTPQNGWYNISYNGVEGWSSGKYLQLIEENPNPEPTSRDLAIAKAKSGVGFSYWWGHGRWVPNGATSSNIGSCRGSCPSCTHGGSYGADCSGYVGKIWSVPAGNEDPQDDAHPYSTVTFNGSNSRWSTISRDDAQPADAFVYNVNGSGHIFLYESGDGWGSMWAYEARGCSYGIVHNLRSAGSDFKAIKRAGY